MTEAEFVQVCEGNGLALDEGQQRCFRTFAASLTAWNAKVNLISPKDIDQLWERHVLHSVAVLLHASVVQNSRVADIGTGGGFPGIPMKICRPDLSIVLVDSIHKKIAAVDAILVDLRECDPRMEHVRAVCGRVEELATLKDLKKSFDVVIARAVAPLSTLVEWAKPLLAAKGRLFALKGGSLVQEIEEAQTRWPSLTISRRALTVKGVSTFEQEEKQLIEVQW